MALLPGPKFFQADRDEPHASRRSPQEFDINVSSVEVVCCLYRCSKLGFFPTANPSWI
jgi:hypothetical protein